MRTRPKCVHVTILTGIITTRVCRATCTVSMCAATSLVACLLSILVIGLADLGASLDLIIGLANLVSCAAHTGGDAIDCSMTRLLGPGSLHTRLGAELLDGVVQADHSPRHLIVPMTLHGPSVLRWHAPPGTLRVHGP